MSTQFYPADPSRPIEPPHEHSTRPGIPVPHMAPMTRRGRDRSLRVAPIRPEWQRIEDNARMLAGKLGSDPRLHVAISLALMFKGRHAAGIDKTVIDRAVADFEAMGVAS